MHSRITEVAGGPGDGGTSDGSGFGMSLWRDEASRDGATDAISQAREAMAAAGVNIDSVEELSVGIAQLPREGR